MSAWAEYNQAVLVREFAALLRRFSDSHAEPEQRREFALEAGDRPAAIDELTAIFKLSRFERDLLLLCAGVEMESALAERCAQISNRSQGSSVTFALALATLREAHWGALAPGAPLRRERLIEMDVRHGLTAAPLRIDERILHYLAGVNQLDQRLEQILCRRERPAWLYEKHWQLAGDTLAALIAGQPGDIAIHLFGDDPEAHEAIAASLAEQAGRSLYVLRAEDTPALGAELDQFATLWTRETLLLPAMLLLQWEGEMPSAAARHLAERLPGPLVIATRDPLRMHRPVEQHEVNKADPRGQSQMWSAALGTESGRSSHAIDYLAEQFRLSAETILRLGTRAHLRTSNERELAHACRAVARPRLETLAERILPSARWDDLVLPELQKQTLRQVAAQSRNRMRVYEQWGFAERGRRGLGLSVLFAGPSGTGKTLAAEVLAAELDLDLYRIDLSSVVSKYIGETEKNLKQVFDAAETGGSVLLFDEADALFGKRAEVKDSHDRYANIEVGYLLQRMETFQGLAILTTNMKSSLDKAFQRRLRFQIDFPSPDLKQREAIWRRVFPEQTPTEALDPARLASLNVSGGSIRNIALNAAFLAAEEEVSIGMAHVLQATRMEVVKAERPLADSEIRGWV
jgi:ATP-dependent 26S proteasome regulatory subunit